MKVILAFDSFKGSLTADQAVHTAAIGVSDASAAAEIVCLPMADGGEGTVEVLAHYTNAKWAVCKVHNSLMRPIMARYALSSDSHIAILEMAAAAGLTQVDPLRRNPMRTTTYGVGEMLLHTIDAGAQHIIIGIGGSATNDGGAGMLAALGAKFYIGNCLVNYPTGNDLIHITSVDFSSLVTLRDIQIEILCDVNNPLFGHNGAAYVYAPQKGANPTEVELLDSGLRNFAHLCKIDPTVPGSGAAGGLGYAFRMLGAQLRKGIDVVLDAAELTKHLQGADLVITGEGKIDNQTLNNKLPFGVMSLAKANNIPTIALAGRVDNIDLLLSAGFYKVLGINPSNSSLSEAMDVKVAASRLRNTTKEVIIHFLQTIDS